ncbi:MAG: AraC family transcriptional regulator [Bacilli bacterium]|nr:AraC family transcriptional regulator [Bacilli bacterium]
MSEEKLLELTDNIFIENNWFFNIEEKEVINPSRSGIHEHNYAEMFLLLSGNVSYLIDNGKYNLESFDFFIVPPHTLHRFEPLKKQSYKKISFIIYPHFLSKLSSELTDLNIDLFKMFGNHNYIIRDPEFSVYIKSYLEKIVNLEKEKSYGYDLLIDNTIREIFISMNRYFSINFDSRIVPLRNKIISEIINYVDNNLDKDLTLKEIAEYLNLDPYYVSHFFSKRTGITLRKYIIKKRLIVAKTLLDQGMEMQEVIKRIGFNDISHFIQSFKKEYGLTPRKYQQTSLGK